MSIPTSKASSHTVTAAELIDLTSRVEDLLFAGIERMTLGADFDLHLWLSVSGSSYEMIAAAADHLDVMVVRMDIGFHQCCPR